MKIGQQPLDEATRKTLEQAYPEVTFDWAALQRTMQQALATPRAPMTPETRRRRAGEERRASGPGGGQGPSSPGGPGGRPPQSSGRMPPGSRPQHQMPPRQRPPYGSAAAGPSGFGDRADQRDDMRRPSFDDTADLPYGAAGGVEPDTDVIDLPGRPYDEPILEEGLESEPRRGGGFSEMPPGPEEIEPLEERVFVVPSGDDDTSEPIAASDELADDDRGGFEHAASDPGAAQPDGFGPGGFGQTKFERPELPGPGFTRDEFPVAASERSEPEQIGPDRPRDSLAAGFTPGAGATDPSAPPRRRRRRRRGGRRSHGGPDAAPQQGSGQPSEGAAEPEYADSEPDGPDGHDDESDV